MPVVIRKKSMDVVKKEEKKSESKKVIKKSEKSTPVVEQSTKSKVNPKAIARERQSLLDKVTKDLEQQGVPNLVPSEMGGVLNIDHTFLTLPSDLTEIPSHHLGNYLNAYTQNRMYLRTLIGWQEIHTEDAKRLYYDKFVPIYNILSHNKMTEKAKEIQANNDDTVKEVFLNYKDEKQKLKTLMYTLDSLDDAIFLISREISRRGADFNNSFRNESVQNS